MHKSSAVHKHPQKQKITGNLSKTETANIAIKTEECLKRVNTNVAKNIKIEYKNTQKLRNGKIIKWTSRQSRQMAWKI